MTQKITEILSKTKFVGIMLTEEQLNKLQKITFVTKKSRSKLVREAINNLIKSHNKTFEKFREEANK